MPQHIQKIAVLRANALGDFIFSLPALTALRETFPQTEIVLLATPWHESYLSNRPSPVNRVIVVPPSYGVRNEGKENKKELSDFFKVMQKESFDIAIQLHGGGRYSNPFLTRLGATVTIGLKTPDAAPLDRWIPYIYYYNEYLRYLEVVSLIGAHSAQREPFLSVISEDIEEVSQKIPHIKTPYIVIHPGATDIRRRWSPKKFAMVGNFLYEKGYQIIITGTKGEKRVVDTTIHSMKYPSTVVLDLTLGGLTGLLSQASCLISNDTGPLHLATALKTPTVGIYWCGNMINGGPLTVKNHRCAISWITYCSKCHTDCASVFPFQPVNKNCQHLVSFVDGVSVEEVKENVLQLLTDIKHPSSIQVAQTFPIS